MTKPEPKKRRGWWIVCQSGDLAGHCLTCGTFLRLPLPMHLSVWCAATHEFVKIHMRCGPPKEKENV